MALPPPIGVTGGSYWGTTGTIPKQQAIPTVSALSGLTIPVLEATVSPSASFEDWIIFQAASDPGVDPVDYRDYEAYLSEGAYVYFATPINRAYRISKYVKIDDTTFAGHVDQGVLPAVADPAYAGLTPMWAKQANSYSYAVQGTGATINGVAFAAGITVIEPDNLNSLPAVVYYDASAVGNSILITFNGL